MGKKRRTRNLQSSMALRRNGLNAFERRDYTEAIEAWERVRRQTPDRLPEAALAEAYFRRGLRLCAAGDPEAGLDDLHRAADLQPEDPRIIYHLGLVAHRHRDLDEAIHRYQAVLKDAGALARRAAYPLALALLEEGEDPTETAAWPGLSENDRLMLSEVSAFKRRPYDLPDDAPILWQAIAALDANDEGRAEDALESAVADPVNPAELQVAHYYRGVLAGRREDWEGALRAWNAARAAGLRMERLEENLQEAYHRLAEQRLERGDMEGALIAGEEALRHGSSYPSLEALVSHAHQRLAHEAVSKGDWAEALEHWQAADAAEGGSFRLAFNLALAHERHEDFLAAAERWREALRRRPRRDDDPDALNDRQVAQLWQRCAEAYTQAGEYDEAVQVLRNAVTWNPERLEARLALSEALMLNGQTEAASNELERVLDRDPDNLPALLHMGEVAYARGCWWQGSPVPYWERVLALDPENVHARQLLVDFYHDQAERSRHWGKYTQAIEHHHKALSYWPGNGRILAALAALHLRLEEYEEAQSWVDQALEKAGDDLMVYESIISAWLDVGRFDEAWRVMEQAEAAVENVPYDFYVSLAHYSIDHTDEMVPRWLDRAVEKAAPGEPVFVTIGEMAMMNEAFDLASDYLERALESGQNPGQAHLILGVISLRQGDTARAEMHWSDAMKIARRNNDDDLRERVEEARQIFYAPPSLRDLIANLGPDLF